MYKILSVLLLTASLVACEQAPAKNGHALASAKSLPMVIVKNKDIRLSYPEQLFSERPFKLQLSFDKPVSELQARLVSVNMDMGFVPVIFKSENKQAAMTTYHADALVGRCHMPTMQWRLEVRWVNNATAHYFEQIINVDR